MVDLSKFISNKKILNEVVELWIHFQVYCQILSFSKREKTLKNINIEYEFLLQNAIYTHTHTHTGVSRRFGLILAFLAHKNKTPHFL